MSSFSCSALFVFIFAANQDVFQLLTTPVHPPLSPHPFHQSSPLSSLLLLTLVSFSASSLFFVSFGLSLVYFAPVVSFLQVSFHFVLLFPLLQYYPFSFLLHDFLLLRCFLFLLILLQLLFRATYFSVSISSLSHNLILTSLLSLLLVLLCSPPALRPLQSPSPLCPLDKGSLRNVNSLNMRVPVSLVLCFWSLPSFICC